MGTRSASWPRAASAATRVLSRMQLPQYMPAAPAVTYATLMTPASLFQGLQRRLRQGERGDQVDEVDGRADGGRGEGDPRRVVGARHERGQYARQGRERRADHPAADVGRHALARAPQVGRVDDGEV